MSLPMSIERATEVADQRNAEMLEQHTKDLMASGKALAAVVEDYLNDGVSDDFVYALAEIARGNTEKALYVGRGTPVEYVTRAIQQHLEKYARLTAPITDEESVLRAEADEQRDEEIDRRMEAA